MQIKDRVFIVTGASSGIGLSTAIALSDRGAKVALLARSSDALQELAQKLPGSLPVTVDMTQFDRVREAVGAVHRHYGRVDGLVNNAGRSYAASVEEIDPALFDEIFHLNVLGPIVAMQAVIPLMRAQGGGSIVNINSGTAFMTVPQYSVYSSSKRALLGFSLTARAELEKDRIVVSEIYPFITATNFGKNRMGNPAGGGPSANYAEGDKPEFVAGLVLQAIEEGQAQYFANDRLRKMAGALAMMVELESTGIKVNLVSPGFTKTNLNGYEGTQSVEEGSREVVRVALLGPDGPTGTFTRWETQRFRGDVPVVGIGASAGGLEAFRELLEALPSDTGMAFVLVSHLSKTYKSMLSELLSKVTKMPVAEVRGETPCWPITST
jgi:NAD(P)-dependent dehydrogenase (short-subunit alcohol dehydrogenase family)